MSAAALPSASPIPFFPAATSWTLLLNNALTAPPVLTSRSAYFPIDGDRLVAYDLASGAQRWIVSAQTNLQPAAGDGLVFLAEPQAISALKEIDGSRHWQVPLTERLTVPPVWDNEWLVAADASGRVSAFRAADGRLIWSQSVGAQAHARPALAGDRVYVSTLDGRVVALSVATGALVWQHRLGGAPGEALAVGDRVYVGADDNYFYCLKADKGDILWRWRTGADIVGAPVADEERVYFVALDNVLRGLSRRTGSQVWKRTLPFRPISGPLQTADALIVAGLSPTLRAFATKDGAPVAELMMAGEMAAPPALVTPPEAGTPVMVAVTRDIAKGASVALLTRTFEPGFAVAAAVAPLPSSLITMPGQSTPTTK